MKQQKPKAKTQGQVNLPPAMAELKALRLSQRATNQRVEDLKQKLFRITEQHMDQAVALIRDWMDTRKK